MCYVNETLSSLAEMRSGSYSMQPMKQTRLSCFSWFLCVGGCALLPDLFQFVILCFFLKAAEIKCALVPAILVEAGLGLRRLMWVTSAAPPSDRVESQA